MPAEPSNATPTASPTINAINAPSADESPTPEATVERQDTSPRRAAQFVDSYQLPAVYQRIGLEQFNLAECTGAPHCMPLDLRNKPVDPWQMVYPDDLEYNHPFRHVFPTLDRGVRTNDGTSGVEFSLYGPGRQDSPHGLSAFLAAPWFQMLNNPYDWDGLRCPCQFGEGSIRSILLDAVVRAVSESLTVDAQHRILPNDPVLEHDNLRQYLSYGYRDHPDGSSSTGLEQAYGDPAPFRAAQSTIRFIHPELPIIQVESTNETRLPYTLDPADFESLDVPAVSISVVFNLSLQRRWETFDDERRDIIRYHHVYQELPQGNGFFPGDPVAYGQLDPARSQLYPNYWHSSDYMHHRILGPVAVRIATMGHDGSLVKDGTYWIETTRDYWPPAPEESPAEVELPGQRPLPDNDNEGWPLPGHIVRGTRITW